MNRGKPSTLVALTYLYTHRDLQCRLFSTPLSHRLLGCVVAWLPGGRDADLQLQSMCQRDEN